jgi:RES domain.
MKICPNCFNDDEIAGFIISSSQEAGRCPICENDNNLLIDIEGLEEFFREFFTIFKYDDLAGKPLIDLIQEDWNIFTSRDYGKKILNDNLLIIDLNEQLGLSLSAILVDAEIRVSFIDEIRDSVNYWDELKEDLKYKRRFLTNIDNLIDYGWDKAFDVFTLIDSSYSLFRSRINIEGNKTPYPKDQMGVPPISNSSSGRANPQGINYLYLSREAKTTLYETRTAFLDYVSVGEFKVDGATELQIVDFTQKISPFPNIDNIIAFTKNRFIREVVSHDLSQPLRRYDSEIEYIPTQFICEYIKFFASPAVSGNIDGIQFNSSLHKGGINVVLFDDKRIKCIDVKTHQINKIDIDSKTLP